MTKPVVLGVEAERELEAAVEWYQQRAELGIDLLVAVRAAASRIAQRPASFPLMPGVAPRLGVRRCVLRAFPYAVLFIELPTELHVLAVAHLRRRPGYWKARLRERR